MADTKTVLNPGVGGDAMDESLVTTTQGAVKRPRVVPGGDDGSLQTFTLDGSKTKADVQDEDVAVVLALVATQQVDGSQRTVSQNPDGQYDGDLRVKQLFDQPNATTMYIGRASVGTASSAALWMIKRITFDTGGNPLSILWTTNTAIWDDRVTETYT